MNKFIRFVGTLFFIIILFTLLYAYAMFQGGFVSWFLFFSFLPIFFYQFGLLLSPLHRWQVKRTLSHHTVRAGDSVTVMIKINRKFPFPLFYCIFEEVIPQTLKRIDSGSAKYYHLHEPNKLVHYRQIKKIAFPWFQREIAVQYELDQIPRGEHQLSRVRIRIGDVFGFIKKEYMYQITDELIAYPNQRQIQVDGKITHINQGEHSAQVFNLKNTNVVSGVREYAPGDKFSWIDWKQTARNHLMMTKEFEQEKSTDTLVILNGCQNQELNPPAFEGAIEVTISLIGFLEKQDSKVGLLSIGKETVHFQGHDDILKKEAIRQYLTRIQPSDQYSFSKQLLKELMGIERHSFVVVVTTDIDTAFYEAVQIVTKQTERLIVLFVQSEKRILQAELEMIQQLKLAGIMTSLLTEKELISTPIEVKI